MVGGGGRAVEVADDPTSFDSLDCAVIGMKGQDDPPSFESLDFFAGDPDSENGRGVVTFLGLRRFTPFC